jgi:hypothetical protein
LFFVFQLFGFVHRIAYSEETTNKEIHALVYIYTHLFVLFKYLYHCVFFSNITGYRYTLLWSNSSSLHRDFMHRFVILKWTMSILLLAVVVAAVVVRLISRKWRLIITKTTRSLTKIALTFHTSNINIAFIWIFKIQYIAYIFIKPSEFSICKVLIYS